MSSSTEAVKPLSDFHTIGNKVYLITPGSYSPREPLILFFSWMGAAAKHIVKYTVAYRKLFPTARIVLIRNDVGDFFRREASYTKLLAPAIDIAKQHVDAGGQVLVHSFSNGGGNQLVDEARGLTIAYARTDDGLGAGKWRLAQEPQGHGHLVTALLGVEAVGVCIDPSLPCCIVCDWQAG
jgi:hypothetical protein